MDRGAWWATVHGVTKSQTRLNKSHTHTHTHCKLSHSVECHFLLQGIFPTQELNPGLLHLLRWQADSLLLSRWGSQCLYKNCKDALLQYMYNQTYTKTGIQKMS